MRNLLERLVKPFTFLVSVALIPMICACSVEMLTFLSTDIDFSKLDFFTIGIVCYLLLYGATLYAGGLLHSHFHFIRTLRHELTHSFATILLGGRVREMLVSNPIEKTGGDSHVETLGLGALLTPFFYLAPYYLPLFTIPFLLLRYLMSSWPRDVIDLLIGFTLTFHFASLLEELLRQRFGLGQSDIRKTGVILSYVVIGLFNLFSLVIIKAMLHDQWPDAEFITGFIQRTVSYYGRIFQFLRRLLPGS